MMVSNETMVTSPFKVEVVLFEPEIPQNTGNIARTCAALGCRLHLVGPLGFRLTDRYLKRAGIDYWHLVEVERCPDLETFFASHTDGQYFFLSTKAKVSYDKANFRGKMYLVFGKESGGLPSFVFERYPNHIFRVPMRPGVRSLNLASTASLVMYEAFRQNGFYGVEGF